MPTYADIPAQRAFGRTADAQPDRVTMRLLVIDDDRDAADYLVKAFRDSGHEGSVRPLCFFCCGVRSSLAFHCAVADLIRLTD